MTIKIKQLLDEDFVNYKLPSMLISFPYCDFKCDRENGMQVCQNSTLAYAKSIEVDYADLVKRYLNNDLTHSIVIGGLEPIENFNELIVLIDEFRRNTDDDIVIYTGFYKEEILQQINQLKLYRNIIIKFGRYIYGHKAHYDNALGVDLASDNQYAERIS